ncbi:MAG: hypothetical protein HYY24_28275 [Verrucomicrobia bacterium]|nr:hypothetical protein [Verrucomicrobiota bacterium]
MSDSVAEPSLLEVGQLGNFEARMLRNFRAAVDDWDEVCSALGAWEAQHLSADDPGPAKERHRRWVTELLSWGQLVQRATSQPEFPDHALAARVNARVRHLQDKLALWHRDMTAAEEDRILLAAFP